MPHESRKTPGQPSSPAMRGQGIDETRAERNGDLSGRGEARPVGSSERLKAEAEGRAVKATTPDGKPYGVDWDPDSHEKGTARTGSPGNEL